MKLKLSTKLFAGFIAIMLLFALVVAVNYQLSRLVLRNSQRVALSQRITADATTLQRNIIDMESGFRGYLLVGNEAVLEHYYQSERELLSRFTHLRSLLPAGSDQYNRIQRAQHLYEQWSDYSHLLISEKREAKRQHPENTSLESMEHGSLAYDLTGKQLTDQIRVMFNTFDREELTLRSKQREKLSDSIWQTRLASISITLLAGVLSLLWASYIVRQISRRIGNMVALATSIAGGNYSTSIQDNDRDELSELANSLNVMARTIHTNITQLASRNEELDQFAYVVSHDLKAPLRGIESASRWIEEDMGQQLPEHIREFLVLMRTRVHRMENLISGILDLARIGRVQQPVEWVSVRELLIDIMDSLAPPAGFTLQLPTFLPTFLTDQVQLQQVFTNLISNAIKYHDQPEQGIVRISFRENRQQYTFSVADNGPGISPEYHERIFVIFQTLTERDTLESTGVGLAIVKKIVERHGGTIWVESEEGAGATFSFTWNKYTTASASTSALSASQPGLKSQPTV